MLRPLWSIIASFFLIFTTSIVTASEREKCMVDWFRRSEMLHPVVTYRVSGGFSVEGPEQMPVLLTEDFFTNSGIQVPAEAKKVDGFAYRYARGSKLGVGQGGGRDILVGDRGKAEKGAGGNSYFSPEFLATDFRRNGLQSVGDVTFELPRTGFDSMPQIQHSGGGIPEYITFRILSRLGVNVVEPTAAAILPEAYQIGLQGKYKDYNLIAMKLRRDISDPVQTAVARPPKKAQIFKLASDFYFYNLSDGAINPDNITATARVKDPGHVGIGYPILSSAYRCTTCTHEMGSSHDHAFIGVLDYYFRGKKFKPGIEKVRSYDHVKFTKSEATDFMQALLGHVNSRRFKSELTKENRDWIYDLTQERFLIEPAGTQTSSKSRSRAVLKTQQAMLGLKVQKGYTALEYKPDRPSLSMRFVMQLAALKGELGSGKFNDALEHVSGWLIGDDFTDPSSQKERQKEFVKMTEWIADLLEEKKVSSSELSRLYNEYAPKSEMESKMGKRLANAGSFEEAVSQIRKTVKEFQKPVIISPKRFYRYVMDLDLSPISPI